MSKEKGPQNPSEQEPIDFTKRAKKIRERRIEEWMRIPPPSPLSVEELMRVARLPFPEKKPKRRTSKKKN